MAALDWVPGTCPVVRCCMLVCLLAGTPASTLPDVIKNVLNLSSKHSDGSLPSHRRYADSRPIIGILSQPLSPADEEAWTDNTGKHTYFAASYSNYASMGGARVVPVLSDSTQDELRDLFSKINGLVVPGGSQYLEPGNSYYDAQSYFMDLAMEAYDTKKEIFPIHFTCLGWEAAALKISNEPNILGDFAATKMSATLNWTPEAKSARALAQVPEAVFKMAETRAISFENHQYGVRLPVFHATNLSDFFTLLSTTEDRNGQVYVSTVEAKRYPFVAVQWHPEKASFEWNPHSGFPHSLQAVQLSQGIANQFIEWARQSTHKFPSREEEDKMLLYNYQPWHQLDAYFDQIYIFPARTGPGQPMDTRF